MIIEINKMDDTLQMRINIPPDMALLIKDIMRRELKIMVNYQKTDFCLLPRNQMMKEMLFPLYMTSQCHYVKVNLLVYVEL